MKYRRPKNKVRRRVIFALVALSLLALIVILNVNITKVLISVAEASMRSITTVAVNDAVYYTLSDRVRYEELVTVNRDEAGNIGDHVQPIPDQPYRARYGVYVAGKLAKDERGRGGSAARRVFGH